MKTIHLTAYIVGFTFIYHSVIFCSRAFRGGRIELSLKPMLFHGVYLFAIVAQLAIIVEGLLTFSWWLPVLLFLTVAPVASILIAKQGRSQAIVVEALTFLLIGCGSAIYAAVPQRTAIDFCKAGRGTWVDAGLTSSANVSLYKCGTSGNGKDVKAWIMYNLRPRQFISGAPAGTKSMRMLEEFDCKNERERTFGGQAYSELSGNGKLLHSFLLDDENARWAPIPPDTSIADAASIVCAEGMPH
jgi:hypothetical protein